MISFLHLSTARVQGKNVGVNCEQDEIHIYLRNIYQT